MSSTPNNGQRFGSLLNDPEIGILQPVAPKRPRWDRQLDEALRNKARRLWGNPKGRNTLFVLLAVLIVGGSVGAYFAFRPVRKPDFQTANIDALFNYTLLTEEFNNLSIEERLALIKQLVSRLKNIDGEQSLLMAMFAAQIEGEVRKQLERNASLLAVDLFDGYAEDFDTNAPEGDRNAFVESKFLEFQRTLEDLAGYESNQTDEERLIDARRQAQRDQKFVQSGGLPVENAVRMLSFVNSGIGREASGHQKIRINGFISQMVRTLREGEVPPEEPREPRRRRPDAGATPPTDQAPGSPPDESEKPVDEASPPPVQPKEIAPVGGGDETLPAPADDIASPEDLTPKEPKSGDDIDRDGQADDGQTDQPGEKADDDGGEEGDDDGGRP